VALATVLLAHSPAFDRFDEILYLVEKASDLTLTDLICRRFSGCLELASCLEYVTSPDLH
jgi:hypothetical protein